LQEDDILDAMKHHHYEAMVSSYSTFNFEKTTSDASLKEVYEKMYRTNQPILPVFNTYTEGGSEAEILGVIDAATLETFMSK
jgi:hypothetical protein